MVTKKQYYWEKLGFFGGHPFLDFLNTFDDLGKSRELDTIPDWEGLLRWAECAAILSGEEAKALATCSAKAAQHELNELHSLRNLGWKIFSSVAAGKSANSSDISSLSQVIQWAYSESTLIQTQQHFSWAISASTKPSTNITSIRIRLILSANDLLSSEETKNIAECGSCTGLFLNKGRGVGRKWCRMKTCGNRAKIHKFRAAK